jgi:hypothetical protein
MIYSSYFLSPGLRRPWFEAHQPHYPNYHPDPPHLGYGFGYNAKGDESEDIYNIALLSLIFRKYVTFEFLELVLKVKAEPWALW